MPNECCNIPLQCGSTSAPDYDACPKITIQDKERKNTVTSKKKHKREKDIRKRQGIGEVDRRKESQLQNN